MHLLSLHNKPASDTSSTVPLQPCQTSSRDGLEPAPIHIVTHLPFTSFALRELFQTYPGYADFRKATGMLCRNFPQPELQPLSLEAKAAACAGQVLATTQASPPRYCGYITEGCRALHCGQLALLRLSSPRHAPAPSSYAGFCHHFIAVTRGYHK